ncbi:LysR family transcriptional regulator [Paenibacillus sp. J5C_2022]|uniref:LysR family transcriptional regulator n=1 Tax=Paenibacillus sp. J5C2022 TaxID=2977129 RepID=UPI0021D0801A|nr:LysR family transcriptional regulator [Paenibacillus sp. J5C2022]MCU6713036.1 LysR family transcriptional regulator [Paenibacillus sp. J5C2022]
MDVSMEWYRVFYWTAKTGSLSRAAQHLHISQPAVSHTLKQLEEELGGALFFRTARGVKLTAAGEALLPYVTQAINFLALGEKTIAEQHQLQHGEIHIGASDTLCKHYLLPYLKEYHAQHPDIRIHITNRTTPETLRLLQEGAIDFGIVSLSAADTAPRGIQLRGSVPIQDCLVAGTRFRHLAAEPLSPEQLLQWPLLTLESGSGTRRYIDRYADDNGIALSPEFELGSIDLLLQFAQSGFGLAFVIRDFVQDELESGMLVEIPLKAPIPPRHIGIALNDGVPLSAASQAFLALLALLP